LDLFSQVLKVLLAIGLFLVVGICSDPSGIDPARHPEFYLLLFTCTLAIDDAGKRRAFSQHLRFPGAFQLFALHPVSFRDRRTWA
jgi:hypothetical protein